MSDPLLRRMGVLVELADRRKDGPRLGKTAVQKLMYLLQEAYGVRLGYRFRFYTHGPYTSEIMGDIDYGDATELLTVAYDHDQGYQIGVGPRQGDVEAYRTAVVTENGQELDNLFQNFGKMSAKELELRATLVWVHADQKDASWDRLVDTTKELKPKFSREEIQSAVEELEKLSLVRPAK